jgi:chromosome segregation ATPase
VEANSRIVSFATGLLLGVLICSSLAWWVGRGDARRYQNQIGVLTENLDAARARSAEAHAAVRRAEEYIDHLEANNREAGRIVEQLEGENSDLRIANRELAARNADILGRLDSLGSGIATSNQILDEIDALISAASD